MVEVYSVDELTETLVYIQNYVASNLLCIIACFGSLCCALEQCEESITGLACGRINSRDDSEIVICEGIWNMCGCGG